METKMGFGAYAFCLASIWLLQCLYRAITSPLRRIPGPFYTTFTRLPLKLATISGQQLYYIHRLHQEYGQIVRIGPDEVAVSSLADFKEIHRVGSGFIKGEWYTQVTNGRLGIFAMRDAKMHAQRRRLFAKPFSKSDLRRNWEPIVKNKVQLVVTQIVNELQDNGVSDILKWATLMATDVSTHLMFGESFEMLRVGKKNEYIRTLESAMMGSGLSVELPLLRTIGRFIPSETFRRLFRAGDYLFEYGKLAVTNGRQTGDSIHNIFSGIISESEKNEATLTDADVAMEAGNLIMAGSDTTAVTLTYLIWAVLSQPALRSQLESELANLSDDYLDTDLETLSLLNAIIMETLRLYGAAPGSLPRSVPQGGVTFSKYYLPYGTTVTTQSYTMHRDPKIFPNPEEFDPTRWLQTDHEVSDEVKTAFSPFGTGSRGCLGIHLSWMELRLAAAEFFRRCGNVRLAPSLNKDDMKPVHYFLIAPSAHRCEVVMDD